MKSRVLSSGWMQARLTFLFPIKAFVVGSCCFLFILPNGGKCQTSLSCLGRDKSGPYALWALFCLSLFSGHNIVHTACLFDVYIFWGLIAALFAVILLCGCKFGRLRLPNLQPHNKITDVSVFGWREVAGGICRTCRTCFVCTGTFLY